MNILPKITTMEGFADCIKEAKPVDDRKFSIKGKEYDYSQLVEKFESLIPEIPTFSTKALAQKVFTNLTKLSPANERMASIRKRLLYTAEEAVQAMPTKTHHQFIALLPKLFEEDPSVAAKLIHNNGGAKAVAITLPSGVVGVDGRGITLFDRAERIYNWEERTKLDFNRVFNSDKPEINDSVFESLLTDWIAKGGLEREGAGETLREEYNKGVPHGEVWVNLKGFPIIPDIVGAIPNLKRLYIDSGAVLQNPEAFQKVLHRDVVLDLIKANPSHIQYIRSELKNDEEFIMEALNQNSAVLKYLPVQCQNKEFLQRTVERAPGIIAYIPEPLRSDRDLMFPLVNAVAFGKDKWQELFEMDVGEVPSLPENIVELLSAEDPFNREKKVAETHMLFLRPAKVNEESCDLITFKKLAPKRWGDHLLDDFIRRLDAQDRVASPRRAEWVLLRVDVIPDSRGEYYGNQKKLVEKNFGYEVPDILSTIVGILTYYATTGKLPSASSAARFKDLDDSGLMYVSIMGNSESFSFGNAMLSSISEDYVSVGAMRVL